MPHADSSFQKTPAARKVAAPKESPQRRRRLLDAAEELFSSRGFYGVTVRQVAEMAEVDVALPNYYFGSKRGLFDAVFHRRAEVLNEARGAGIDAVIAAAGDGRPSVEDILHAFIQPVLEAQASSDPGWRNYCRLVAQVNSSAVFAEMMSTHFDELIAKLISALRIALPHAKERELYWAYHFLTGALTLTMADTGRIDHLSHGLCHSADAHDAYRHLVTFFARGFTAAAND
ncbi:TetR/AcrR family transcriptional regulator [Asticcacaulis sp. 201]|uniref:TetR/AcrR family transcriptional regulator n=1 Tax=Asticcacaulis sp. 201 TaxID=3028787 RepID=UPI002916103D|nr:TetR/AcrR family transcriptional regulator [Asticcacaulis sp. 201]MDV6331184.1 TetR/AcrR family transcriptional regulator [Asticcacaulis sp. 201]